MYAHIKRISGDKKRQLTVSGNWKETASYITIFIARLQALDVKPATNQE